MKIPTEGPFRHADMQIRYHNNCNFSITCKIDFDDFLSRPRVLSRRRRAAKRGFKLPTKRRFAQLQTRLELMDKIQDDNEESVIPGQY